MPIVSLGIDARGATTGAAEVSRALQLVKRDAAETVRVLREVEQAQKAATNLGSRASGDGGSAAQAAAIERVTVARTRQLTVEQQADKLIADIDRHKGESVKLQQAETREIERRIRVGLTLLSTLGGEDRAFSQLTNAQIRQAQALGQSVDAARVLAEVQARVASSSQRMAEVFSTSAVNARDLRLNMAGMNAALGGIARAIGGPGGPISIIGSQFAGASQAISAFTFALGSGNPIIAAFTLATTALSLGLSRVVKEGEEAERSLLRIQAIQRASGGASGFTSDEIISNARALADATNFTSDALEVASAKLLTFRSISGDTFKDVLVLATDAAEVFGSLDGALVAIARAIEAPAENMGGLRRQGLALNQTIEDQIIALDKAGRSHEATALLVQALQDKIGGTGAGAATGLSGAWNRLTESLEDYAEQANDSLGVTEKLAAALNFLAGGQEAANAATKAASIEAQLADKTREIAFLERRGGPVASRLPELRAEREELVKKLVAQQAEIDLARLRGAQVDRELEANRKAAKAKEEAAKAAEQHKKALEGEAEALKREVEALIARNELEFDSNRNKVLFFPDEERDRVLEALRKQETERNRLLESAARDKERRDEAALRDAERISEAQARAFQEPFLEAARNVQNAISGSIRTALDGEVQSVEDFSDVFLSIIKDMVAEAATLLVFRPVLEGFAGGGTGGGATGGIGGLLSGIFGGGPPSAAESREAARSDAQTAAMESTAETLRRLGATNDQIASVGLDTATNTAATATNTTGLLGTLGKLAGSLAAAGAGATAGFGLGTSLGGNAVAGGIGGAIGGVAGSLLGPIGGALGGFLGSFVSSLAVPAFTDLINQRNPSQGKTELSGGVRGAVGGFAIAGHVGAIIGAIIGIATAERDRVRAAILTRDPALGGSDPNREIFAGGASALGPFGLVGFSADRSKRTENEQKIAESIAQFDAQLAAHIDPGLVDLIANLLQNTDSVQVSALKFDKEFSALLVNRAQLAARALLEGSALNIGDSQIDTILNAALPASFKGSPQEIADKFAAITDMLEGFERGIRDLRGEDISEAEDALNALRDQFGALVPSSQALGVSLETLTAALAAGQEKLRSNFRGDLTRETLKITDPFTAAIDAIADEEQRLLREAQALGTGFAEVASFISATREELLERQLQPVNDLLDSLRLDRLGPLQQLDVLGERFTGALAGNDAGELASAAQNLLAASEQAFGRTSLFFERQAFIERSLENFSERLRGEVFSNATAIQTQTNTLAANQEEQTRYLAMLVGKVDALTAENARLRADLNLVLARLAA